MDKLVKALRADGDFKAGILTIAGACVTLSPYVALGMGFPVPDDVVWMLKMSGFFMLASGVGISIGYTLAVFSRKKNTGPSTADAINDPAHKGPTNQKKVSESEE